MRVEISQQKGLFYWIFIYKYQYYPDINLVESAYISSFVLKSFVTVKVYLYYKRYLNYSVTLSDTSTTV